MMATNRSSCPARSSVLRGRRPGPQRQDFGAQFGGFLYRAATVVDTGAPLGLARGREVPAYVETRHP
jgi:hypothetical protein